MWPSVLKTILIFLCFLPSFFVAFALVSHQYFLFCCLIGQDAELSGTLSLVLTQCCKRIKDTVQKLASDHKDIHSSVSRVGKAIDKVWSWGTCFCSFSFHLSYCIVGVYLCACQKTVGESVFLFHVGLWDWTQIIKIGSRLSSLMSPSPAPEELLCVSNTHPLPIFWHPLLSQIALCRSFFLCFW